MAITINGTGITSSEILDGTLTEADWGGNQLSHRNLIINGDMRVAQRGTSVSSVSSSGYVGVDHYRHTVSIGTWTISQSTDAPDGFGYSMKMDCTTAEASPPSASALAFVQKIEGQDLQQLKKGTASSEQVTLSFWVKCTKTGTAQVNLVDEDNIRMIGQQFTISATNTWEQKTLTFAGDTTGAFDNDQNTSLRVEIWLDAGSSYKSGATPTSWESLSTTDYFAGCDLNLGDSTSNDIYITGLQLEVGSVATPFEHRSYGDELARCQRYYYKWQTESVGSVSGISIDGSKAMFQIYFPVKMRAKPTFSGKLSEFGNIVIGTWDGSNTGTSSSFAETFMGQGSATVRYDHGRTFNNTTIGRPVKINTNLHLADFDAEL